MRRASPLLIVIMVVLTVVAGGSTPTGLKGAAVGPEDDTAGWRWATVDPAGWRWATVDPAGWRWD